MGIELFDYSHLFLLIKPTVETIVTYNQGSGLNALMILIFGHFNLFEIRKAVKWISIQDYWYSCLRLKISRWNTNFAIK